MTCCSGNLQSHLHHTKPLDRKDPGFYSPVGEKAQVSKTTAEILQTSILAHILAGRAFSSKKIDHSIVH
jgi:hypothetical protein